MGAAQRVFVIIGGLSALFVASLGVQDIPMPRAAFMAGCIALFTIALVWAFSPRKSKG